MRDLTELDLTDPVATRRFFDEERPEAVIDTAEVGSIAWAAKSGSSSVRCGSTLLQVGRVADGTRCERGIRVDATVR